MSTHVSEIGFDSIMNACYQDDERADVVRMALDQDDSAARAWLASLRGRNAVVAARSFPGQVVLCKYSDPVSGAEHGLDPDDDVVDECLEADPGLLYVETVDAEDEARRILRGQSAGDWYAEGVAPGVPRSQWPTDVETIADDIRMAATGDPWNAIPDAVVLVLAKKIADEIADDNAQVED